MSAAFPKATLIFSDPPPAQTTTTTSGLVIQEEETLSAARRDDIFSLYTNGTDKNIIATLLWGGGQADRPAGQ